MARTIPASPAAESRRAILAARRAILAFRRATIATQHPDNASSPYWEKNGDGFVSTQEEVMECYSAFRDLGCQEFMWDWDEKYVDEAVIEKLFHNYYDFFKKHELGKDVFLTFRIPNIWREGGHSLARAMMGIITAANYAYDAGFRNAPIFEVILPFTDSARKMMYVQKTFTELANFKNKLFKERSLFRYIHILPLFEGINELFECRKILEEYVRLHTKFYKKKPAYIRPHIARSDPALNAGLVSSVVAGKIALSELYRFEELHKIRVFPAIGAGALPFRGGLSPERIDDFLQEFSGAKTVYIQSAFRYDFSFQQAKAAIARLNSGLSGTKHPVYTEKEIQQAKKISRIFSFHYRKTIENLAGVIQQLSRHVPRRRERKLHVGHLGHSRNIGKNGLPRAIPFTAAFYSLGVPPEFIGAGRGLQEAAGRHAIEHFYHNFKKDLQWAGRFLNKENLKKLVRHKNGWPAELRGWRQIQKDVEMLERLLHTTFGPKSRSDIEHYKVTARTLNVLGQKKSITDLIIRSGKIRRSLG